MPLLRNMLCSNVQLERNRALTNFGFKLIQSERPVGCFELRHSYHKGELVFAVASVCKIPPFDWRFF